MGGKGGVGAGKRQTDRQGPGMEGKGKQGAHAPSVPIPQALEQPAHDGETHGTVHGWRWSA